MTDSDIYSHFYAILCQNVQKVITNNCQIVKVYMVCKSLNNHESNTANLMSIVPEIGPGK